MGDAYNIIIAVKMFIFLCVAQMLPCKKQDAPELSKPRKHQKVENMEAACYPGQLCVIFGICFQLQCVLSCQGAWLHPLYSSVEVALYPDLTHSKYLGLRLGEKVLYVGSSHPLRSCIRLYNTCSNTLIYLWSLILLCGDVETNPGPTNGSDVDIDVHR